MNRSFSAPHGLTSRQHRIRLLCLITLWALAAVAILLRCHLTTTGWDVHIYLQAVDSIRAGHDPYADAIARQIAFHQAGSVGETPFSYVYAPITLPFLWIVSALPLWISAAIYWTLYAAGGFAQILVGFRFTSDKERNVFLYCLPAAIFFPGLLASDIVWSGNIAFLLYGAVLAAALFGWTRGKWMWFYIVTVAAGCFKTPLLTLLAIPVLSAPRQWKRSCLAALAGMALFGSQAIFAPTLFRHYLQAVELQFSYNRDFGVSPAGLFSGWLFDHNLSYSPAAYFVYLAYAIPVCIVLFQLSRLFFAHRLTLSQWAPVLLVGVVLLNPRILEYDEILLALPMALILWRFCRSLTKRSAAIALASTLFLGFNVVAYRNWNVWKLTEGPLLIACFIAGCWTLYREAAMATATVPSRTSRPKQEALLPHFSTQTVAANRENVAEGVRTRSRIRV